MTSETIDQIEDWIEGLETIEWWFRDEIIHDIKSANSLTTPEGMKDETSYVILLKNVRKFLEDFRKRELLEPGSSMVAALKELKSDHLVFRQRMLILENSMEKINQTFLSQSKEEEEK